jgi:hypothetical protein
MQWVEIARYLAVALDKRLTWSAHVNRVRKRAAEKLRVLGPLLKGRTVFSTA